MFSYLTPSWSRDIVNCLRDKDMTSFSTLAEAESQITSFKPNKREIQKLLPCFWKAPLSVKGATQIEARQYAGKHIP